ncbi:hypothetical protein F4604DRAFT_1929914 [Suillus subluteus]|nr:hypothetical protein F4604DRAFT_1929914 [Suillus subluteus]
MALRLDHANSASKFLAGSRLGDGIPPTFCVMPCDSSVTAVWEPSDMSETSGMLEVPVLFHPDTDFQSMDGSNIVPELWLEMPLTPE